MKPAAFKLANKTLQPSDKVYSTNVDDVKPLQIWSDDEQCVSLWKMTWRERISALFFGCVWIAVLSGRTQPPIYAEVCREYLKELP